MNQSEILEIMDSWSRTISGATPEARPQCVRTAIREALGLYRRMPELEEEMGLLEAIEQYAARAGVPGQEFMQIKLDEMAEDARPKAEAAQKAEGWRGHVKTAANLQRMTFPEIKYVVPGLIPEGLSIFAGKPKVGKSWAALDVALAVASGGYCFGDRQPLVGDVLYCALEDNDRRLQKRIRKIMEARDHEWPKRLTLATQWRRFDAGGVDDAREWADSVPNPVLVIFDTLAGVKPAEKGGENIYSGDYRALGEVHKWANEKGIAVLILHHMRKAEADDPLDGVSGSLGLVGCADTTLVLARSSQGATLYLRGRDIEEAEHAIVFDKDMCRWTIMGDASEVRRSDSRQKILSVLTDAEETMTPAEIATATGITRNAVDQLLWKMGEDGEVTKVSRGHYVHHRRTDLIPHKNPKNKMRAAA